MKKKQFEIGIILNDFIILKLLYLLNTVLTKLIKLAN